MSLKHNLNVLTVLLLIMLVIFSSSLLVSNNVPPLSIKTSKEVSVFDESAINNYTIFWNFSNIVINTPVHVIFVGYNSDLILLNTIDSYVQKEYKLSTGGGDYTVYLNMTYHFTNESFTNDFHDFINAISYESTTSKLNETALKKQLDEVNKGNLKARYSIFLEQDGIAINATDVENWLVNHLDSKLSDGYVLFVLNMSYLDNSGKKHWFFVPEIDIDSNRTRDFWRLEWENELNPNVSFPYAAFASKTNVMFIDPYAYNWYLAWARIWWGSPSYYSDYDARYWKTLGDFIKTLDISTDPGKDSLSKYLAGWISDFLDDLLGYSLDYSLIEWNRPKFYTNSVSVQVKIINAAENVITDSSKLDWLVHPAYIIRALNSVLPYAKIDVEIQTIKLSEDERLSDILLSSKVSSISTNDWSYYNGYSLYNSLYSLREEYFDLQKASTVLTSWLFVLNNGSMVIYYGDHWREFTGLGGGGQTMILMNLDRLFTDRETLTPKRGFTSVLIHEVGHALGYGHIFHEGSYASDFAFDVMGYYPGAWNYSKIRVDDYFRTLSIELIRMTASVADSLLKIVTDRYMPFYFKDLWNDISTDITQALILLNSTHYGMAFRLLHNSYCSLDNFYNIILSDDKPPKFTYLSIQKGSSDDEFIVSWNATDEESFIDHYEYSIDNGPWHNLYKNQSFTIILAQGMHTINVKAVDVAGNIIVKSITVVTALGTIIFSVENSIYLTILGISVVAVVLIFIVWQVYKRKRKIA